MDEKSNVEIIGENIRRIRKAKNITQTSLANKIGKSLRTVQHYESGTTDIPLLMLERIANALQISLPELCQDYVADIEPIPKQHEEEIIKIRNTNEILSSGEKIKQVRKSRKLTQKQLAEKCGMHESAIGRIETSKGIPRAETLDKIAKALGVRAAELLPNWSMLQTRTGIIYDTGSADIDEVVKTEVKRWEKDENDSHTFVMFPDEKADTYLIDRIVTVIQEMNFLGKIRVINYALDLTRIPDYLNEEGEKEPYNLQYMWPNNQVDQRFHKRAVELMQEMNLSGKIRVIHYAEELTRIPDYVNKEGE